MKKIIGYSTKIAGTSSLEKFTDLTEKIIMELFSSSSAMVLLYINNRLENEKTKKFIKQKKWELLTMFAKRKKYMGVQM